MRSSAKVVMAVLALAGITGMYLRQVRRQAGLLGLVGYLRLRRRLPDDPRGRRSSPRRSCRRCSTPTPATSHDVLVAATGGTPLATSVACRWSSTSAVSATSSAGWSSASPVPDRVLARWASVLLAVGTPPRLALAVLPDAFNRPFAVPTGIALIGLGVSLWRTSARPGRGGGPDRADRPHR